MKRNIHGITMLFVTVSMLFLSGCFKHAVYNIQDPAGDFKIAPCGFKYKIIEIEGKRFIAYQTAHFTGEVARLD